MNSTRTASVVTGALFLLADVAGVCGVTIVGSALTDSDVVGRVGADPGAVSLSAALVAAMGLCCAGIAAAMYPVLRRVSSAIAMGSAVLRIAEGAVFLVAALALLTLVSLSGDVRGGELDAAAARPSANLLAALYAQTGPIAALPFALGAFLYYVAFWVWRLTPRWLAGWGIAAISIYFVTALGAILTRTDFDTLSAFLMPLAVQEVVLAVWLIARGFRQPAEAAETGFARARGRVAAPSAG